MTLLGKVLALLNIFGMIGLMVFALLVYAKREAWAYANYRFDLAANGLPQHKEEKDAEGNLKYEDLSEQTRSELFPNNPVSTQKEEVERVQKVLQAKLNGESDKPTQTALYATMLLPLARTNAERERLVSIRRHLADAKTTEQLKKDLRTAYKEAQDEIKDKPGKPLDLAFAGKLIVLGGEPRRPFEPVFLAIVQEAFKAPPDAAKLEEVWNTAFADTVDTINKQLKESFDREFAQVLEGKYQFVDDKGNVTKKDMTTEERRDATSYLLFNLVEITDPAADAATATSTQLYQSPAYKRYLTVVGLAEANRTINQQVSTLSRILSDLVHEKERDRDSFAATLLPILEQSRDLARHVEKLKVELTNEQSKVDAQDSLVKKRKADVDEAEKKLAELRQTTGDKLVELRALSKAVFDLRVEVRDKTVSNQENERLIRELEGWRWVPFIGGHFLLNREEP